MIADCLSVLKKCTDLMGVKHIHTLRSHMAENMAEFFNATSVILLGLDETNERCITLATWPENQNVISADMEEAERNESPLYWAFNQQQCILENTAANNPLRALGDTLFPTGPRQNLALVPAPYLGNNYPDLIFILAGFHRTITNDCFDLAMAFGRFCAALNRMTTGIDKIENRQDVLARSLEQITSTIEERKKLHVKDIAKRIIGYSPVMQKIHQEIARFAPTDVSVLIHGETGTGKELVARELHFGSQRCNKAFIAVNIAAIPDSLIESELFGHIKGAFTGAETSRTGLLGDADGGTLFLDEIGDLSINLQSKLLRVLQEKTYRPLGSNAELRTDVRIIAATHQDLGQRIQDKLFREDLYYRLAGGRINLPPLKERGDDIIVLAESFLIDRNAQTQNTIVLSDEAKEYLKSLLLPGNVRQLKAVITSALIACDDALIINKEILHDAYLSIDITSHPSVALEALVFTEGLQQACDAFEKKLLVEAMLRYPGQRQKIANELHVPIRTLYNKLKKHRLEGRDDAQIA